MTERSRTVNETGQFKRGSSLTTIPSNAAADEERKRGFAPKSLSRFAIDIVESAAAFVMLRDEWNELLSRSRSDCLFLTWEWLHTWWKYLGQNTRLHIITVRAGGRLMAIAPLTLTRAGVGVLGVPMLEFAGTGIIGSDYLDFIVSEESEAVLIDVLASFIAQQGQSVRLHRVSKESAVAHAVCRRLVDHGWQCLEVPTDVSPFIDLSGQSWEDYLSARRHKHRSNFRRSWRNLNKRFAVRVQWADSESARRIGLHHVVDLHVRRWSGRASSNAFDSTTVLDFHDEVSRLADACGWLRLLTLTLDDKPACAFYGFRYGPRFYFYQSGFDPMFYDYSVGLVTVGLTIQEAIREGASEYDFLHGNETYKSRWATQVRQLVRLELYPPGRIGFIHRNVARALGATKKLAERVR